MRRRISKIAEDRLVSLLFSFCTSILIRQEQRYSTLNLPHSKTPRDNQYLCTLCSLLSPSPSPMVSKPGRERKGNHLKSLEDYESPKTNPNLNPKSPVSPLLPKRQIYHSANGYPPPRCAWPSTRVPNHWTITTAKPHHKWRYAHDKEDTLSHLPTLVESRHNSEARGTVHGV